MQCSIIVIFNNVQTSAEVLTSEFKAAEQLHRLITINSSKIIWQYEGLKTRGSC